MHQDKHVYNYKVHKGHSNCILAVPLTIKFKCIHVYIQNNLHISNYIIHYTYTKRNIFVYESLTRKLSHLYTLNLLYFLYGTIYLPFLELSIISFREGENLKVGQPTVYRLDRKHGCADWFGSILVAKANHFRFQRDKG